MANLVELFDNIVQMQNLNGVPLANGKMYVYALGRTRLMDTWSDVDGESLNSNPIILDAAGQCHCYVTDDFDYTIVVTDEYNNEIFSIDKYLYSQGSHSHADVAVAPSETIAVSSYHVGETTVYVPYLTGQLGKVYQGIDPIVVNNTEDKISANHVPLGVQDPLYFVQDDEEGCIIGCSAQTEIPSAISGKWDAASDAVITNSAQWAENTEYEAGNYISIDDNVINVTGLSPVPTDTASTGLVAQVSAEIVSQIPSTAGLATESWVEGKNYATVSQLDNKLDKADSAKFYPMTGNPSGFLTSHQSLAGYATEQWVEDKGYLTGVDIPESANWNSTYNTVHDNSASWTGGSTPNPQIPVTGINGIKISESGDQVVFEVSGDYYTNDNPSGFITGVDLSDYATTAQLAEKQDSLSYGYHDSAISSIDESALYDTSAHARINTLAGRISDLSSNKLDTTAFSDVSGTFLTAHQDLSDYQTTAGMTAYQPVGDYLTTADSANFYTTANESGFITGVPDTYLQNTDLSTEDGKVTAISGIPLSAGGDVPEGVMVESGLEFNAVDEISGYNGSAFAQYGAEKQFIVHDDTLVHLSNSAQYALGCNISALQRLMGIDETVLWINPNPQMITTGTSLTAELSEPISAFKQIRFDVKASYDYNESIVAARKYVDFIVNDTAKNEISLWLANPRGTTVYIDACLMYLQNNMFTAFSGIRIQRNYPSLTGGSDNTTRGPYIYGIYGIGRKEV